MREGGGFFVWRFVGDCIDYCDLFFMLDYLGLVVYGLGEVVGVFDYFYCGFEIVIYFIDGKIWVFFYF